MLYEEGLESSEEQIRMGMKMFDLDNLKIFTGTKTDTKVGSDILKPTYEAFT